MSLFVHLALVAMTLGYPLTEPAAEVVPPQDETLMDADAYVRLLLSEPDEDVEVLLPENPWEFRLDYASILKVGDYYVMYYRALHKKKKPYMVVCMAVSQDGIHWVRPELNAVDFMGDGGKNNIISDNWNGVGFEYKDGTFYLLADRFIAEDGETTDKTMHFYTSKDGVHFTEDKSVSIPFFCDSQNQIMWDPDINKFRFYLRSWYRSTDKQRKNLHSNRYYRTVSYYESPDLRFSLKQRTDPIHLAGKDQSPAISTELPVIIKNKTLDEYDFYYGAVHKYLPNLYIAYPCYYYFFPDTKNGGEIDNDGYATIGFWISQDGKSFVELKKDYITNGQNWLESCIGHVETDDYLIHYYIPFNNTHTGKHQQNSIRARIHYKSRMK